MDSKDKFDNDIKALLDKHTVPLREVQWNRLEVGLISQNAKKKRFWLFIIALAFVSVLSFGTGYFLNNPNPNTAQNTLEQSITTPQNYNTIDASKISETIENINITEHKERKIKKNQIRENNSTDRNETAHQDSELNKLEQSKKSTSGSSALKGDEENGTSKSLQSGSKERANTAQLTLAKADKLGGLSPINGSYGLEKNAMKVNSNLLNEPRLEMLNWAKKGIANYRANSIKAFSLPIDFLTNENKIEISPKPDWMSSLDLVKNSLALDFLAGGYATNNAVKNPNTTDSLKNESSALFEKQGLKGSGYTFGVNLRSYVYKGLNVGAGVNYNQTNEKSNFTFIQNKVPFYDSANNILGYIHLDDSFAPKIPVTVTNKYSYLQIPLHLGYEQMFGAKLLVGIHTQYVLKIPMNTKYDYFDVTTAGPKLFQKGDIKLGSGLGFGLNVGYKIYKPLWLGLNYQYQKSTNQFTIDGQNSSKTGTRQQLNLSLTIKL